MSSTLQLGPFTLPWQLLLVMCAVTLSSVVGHRLAKGRGIDVDPPLFRILLVAIVVARLAFVWQFFDVYRASPMDIIDIRDGGWRPLPGLAAAWLYAGSIGWRSRPLRLPVWSALASATVIWALGAVLLASVAPIHTPLPSISLVDLDGREVQLRQFEGKPTVVNLWATWCPPCRREMPVLAQAQTAHRDVHFVFLNQGEAVAKVSSFLAGEKLVLDNVLLDARGQASSKFGQRALPTTLFFDARGRLIDTRIGELSAATLTERLRALEAVVSSNPTEPPPP